jgi:hypothetical protein
MLEDHSMSTTAFYLAAATAAAAITATPALADGDRAPFEGMTEQAISQIVTYAGYDVVEVDLLGRIYRGEAYVPAGAQVKLRVLAEDGSILPPSDRRDGAVAVRD